MKTKEEIEAQPEFQMMLNDPYEGEEMRMKLKNFGKVIRDWWYYFMDDYTCTYPETTSRTVPEYEAFWEQIKKDFPTKKVAETKIPKMPSKAQIEHMCPILNLDSDVVIEVLKKHWNDVQ